MIDSNSKKRILIFTDAYPYGIGEEFIVEELKILSRLTERDVILFPLIDHGVKRWVPEKFGVSNILANINPSSIFKVIGSVIFYRELRYLLRSKRLSFRNLKIAIHELRFMLAYQKILASKLGDHGNIELAYTYWNEKVSYACVNLGLKTISRVHRYDLYEERRPNSYMPLKRQFLDKYWQIHTLDESIINYFRTTYNFESSSLIVSRLGVDTSVSKQYSILNNDSDKSIRLVSIAHISAVKRIPKIISVVEMLQNQGINVTWDHIGDGPDRSELEKHAMNTLIPGSFKFHGHVQSDKVLYQLRKINPNYIINLSSSEGVPVSIMQAMSLGIIPIANNVGGMIGLVSYDTGLMVSPDADPNSIANTILKFDASKPSHLNVNCMEHIEKNFDSEKNYTKFCNITNMLE